MSRPKKVCTLVVPQLTRPLLLLGILKKYGAEGGTRTPTGYPTRPSNVRVYQFRHFGSFRKDVKNQQGSGAGYLLGCGDGTITVENGVGAAAAGVGDGCGVGRSEERRVGKECRSRW